MKCIHRYLLVAVGVIGIAFCPLRSPAQSDNMAGTISRMPVKKMKAEFDAKGSDYVKSVRKEVETYVTKVCETLADTARYNNELNQKIAALKSKLNGERSLIKQYELWEKLFDLEYLVDFEYAYQCAQHCEDIAREMQLTMDIEPSAGSPKQSTYDYLAQAYIYKAKSCTNSGYFREGAEALQKVVPENCSKTVRINYIVAAFNLEFENGFYTPYRFFSGDSYLDNMTRFYGELKKLVPADSYLLDDMLVKMYFHETKYAEAVEQSKVLLSKLSPACDYYAYAVGNLGYNYMGMKDYAKAAEFISQSAVLEIKRGSHEYPAARKIAEVAYITGDITRSFTLINVAMNNAFRYHSKYRYSEIACSYPHIGVDLNELTQKQKMWLIYGLVFLGFVVVFMVFVTVVIIRQRKALHRQKSLIESQMQHLREKSDTIANINRELLEAGHIKEVVLGQLIVSSANHQIAIEKLRKEVLRRLTVRDYDGIRNVFDSQKGDAFDSFYQIDNILLMLFPNFSDSFNALLRPECRTAPKAGERLTAEMRIYALIRLGITKNEDLARSLNYSVNTIKSYKTRVVNAAICDKEEFYRRLKEEINADFEEKQ